MSSKSKEKANLKKLEKKYSKIKYGDNMDKRNIVPDAEQTYSNADNLVKVSKITGEIKQPHHRVPWKINPSLQKLSERQLRSLGVTDQAEINRQLGRIAGPVFEDENPPIVQDVIVELKKSIVRNDNTYVPYHDDSNLYRYNNDPSSNTYLLTDRDLQRPLDDYRRQIIQNNVRSPINTNYALTMTSLGITSYHSNIIKWMQARIELASPRLSAPRILPLDDCIP